MLKKYYGKIYNMLDEVTPLSKDCGVLCDKACCKEEDEPAGMFVFPFEEELLEKELEGYKEYKKKVKYRLIPFVW